MLDFQSILSFATNLLIFLAGLSVIVLFHEFGHFMAAKRAGIKVEEFGLGFPPKVLSIKRGETEYSLNALPIGGFVRLYGEEHSVERNRERSFYHKNKLTRLSVIIAGVIMNLLLGMIIFTLVYSQLGVPGQTKTWVLITYVFPDSPAQLAGLQTFDHILTIGGEKVERIEQVKPLTAKYLGQEIIYEIERKPITFLADGIYTSDKAQVVSVKVTPRKDNEAPVGIGLEQMPVTQTKMYPWFQMPFKSIEAGIGQSLKFTKQVVTGLFGVVSKLATRGEVPKDVAGPIGIFQITQIAAQSGILTLLSLFGILSVNLAVVNILPIPALDGGRLLFVVLESIFKRRVFPRVETIAHQVGMVLLLLLLILISLNDIARLRS